ncbi:MAG: UDP-N-acetylmuramoyl-tripeptide--D-alanyl-D-alanine ligase [Crocinitomicaceae bacterium]|nr:UDP-N-acetylmuramoyl-tripeptide--D-alanyl-D-alanine ligase [Crocinitomicaceae bacterium]|tara:strand:+ start:1831 stop:3117 length:1287 start_codon:yes stop_codon:yes gene_type:complete
MSSQELLKIFLNSTVGITTDSRNCKKGMIFFALKGENFDGNKYAKKALEAGCNFAVVDDKNLKGVQGVIIVDDVLKSLQDLAREYRRTLSIPVVGLTGSNGKTTTKELITAVLSRKYKVHATKGNLNNHIGVPLTLLSTPSNTEILVIEMGANHCGEIATLCSIAEPTCGLITNIGRAHLEGFGGITGVKKGKGELFEFLRTSDGTLAFVNANHEVLIEISTGLETKLYGNTEHEPWAKFIEGDERKFVWFEGGESSDTLPVQLEGDYNLDNITTAIALGLHFGVDRKAIGSAISDYAPTNNRSQTIKTEHNTILLDAYNANPSSMTGAIESFAKNIEGPKLVVLGDMRELGMYSHEAHKEIVGLCERLGLEGIFVGEEFYAASERDARFYQSTEDLIRVWESESFNGKTVLLKGSRGMRMEQLLPLL